MYINVLGTLNCKVATQSIQLDYAPSLDRTSPSMPGASWHPSASCYQLLPSTNLFFYCFLLSIILATQSSGVPPLLAITQHDDYPDASDAADKPKNNNTSDDHSIIYDHEEHYHETSDGDDLVYNHKKQDDETSDDEGVAQNDKE